MSARIIPVLDQRQPRRPETPPALPVTAQPLRGATGELHDSLGRALHDLRISVTDRCNFRCGYCMPREIFGPDYPHLPHRELLSFEEITRLARAFAAHGVRKIRLTGGEPLLRKNIEVLIEQLSQLRTPDGQPLELTLTTNASLLARKARALKDAGLKRVTVSLDALDDAVFRRMNDADFPVADVLEGIDAARAAGLAPIKINMVVQRGVNDGEILPMARHFKREGLALRFIEYMDVGASNGWRMDQVLPSRDVLQLLQTEFALRPLEAAAPGETAERWAYEDGSAEVGFISSVTKAFCGDCNRARISIEGRLFLCLFASQGYDLRALLRPEAGEASDEEITSAIAHIWTGRKDRYSELRAALPPEARQDQRRVEMSYIGG